MHSYCRENYKETIATNGHLLVVGSDAIGHLDNRQSREISLAALWGRSGAPRQ